MTMAVVSENQVDTLKQRSSDAAFLFLHKYWFGGGLLTQMDYVYCTKCSNFGLASDLTPVCAYSELCDLWDPEDGRRLYMRPYYTPMTDNVRSPRALISKIPNKDGTIDYYIQEDLLNDILQPFTVDEENIDQDGSLIYYKHDED